MMALSGRRRMAAALVAVSLFLAVAAGQAAAHADYDSAVPAAGSSVEHAPPAIEITFSQEVTDGTSIEVVGPDGRAVHAAPAQIDLNDPDRKRVTVALYGNLPAGVYTVNWVTVSAEDGDTDSGSFTFTVTVGSSAAASPEASPIATPAASPVAAAVGDPREQVRAAAEAAQEEATRQAAATEMVDGSDLGLAVLAGIGAAIVIYLFWRLVRPKPGERVFS